MSYTDKLLALHALAVIIIAVSTVALLFALQGILTVLLRKDGD